jgi:KDO2-lipid IV(A) lauroyltransferase
VKTSHRFETALAKILRGGIRRAPWHTTLGWGVALGETARALGLRRRVAEQNLALAFPERGAEERAAILAAHYHELGRVLVEYARLSDLVRAPEGQVVDRVDGLEHLEAARVLGKGVLLLTGHFGNFELLGAWLGRIHPVDFVVQPLSNPGVDEMLARERERAGVGQIPIGGGVRGVLQSLAANRWVALVADQDARRHGVFVPFFGRPASTPAGPARIALRTGAPIVMGFAERLLDGRHRLRILPPLIASDPAAPDAVRALTALHTAELERQVRARPEMWFWLHRRWKTRPDPLEVGAEPGAAPESARAEGWT